MKRNNFLSLIMVGFILASCNNKTLSDYEIYIQNHPEYISSEDDFKNEQDALKSKKIEPSNIKNIVYIVGDGMGPNSIIGAEHKYNKTFSFVKWKRYLSDTNSLDSSNDRPTALTDSAAGGTALATGSLTYNGFVGRDNNNEFETVLDVAKENGKKTAIVTTDELCGATPSAFSAHSKNRNNFYEIVSSQAKSEVDLLIGLYSSTVSEQKEEYIDNGYTYIKTLDNTVDKNKKILINNTNLLPWSGDNDLSDSVNYALNYLDDDEDGFFLMIEAAHIDKFAHKGDFDRSVDSLNELNNTVDLLIKKFEDREDTLIVITSDHETGGLRVSKGDKYSCLSNNGSYDYSYEYETTSHTNTLVGVYTNFDVFNFGDSEDNNEIIKIKNNVIGLELKRILKAI